LTRVGAAPEKVIAFSLLVRAIVLGTSLIACMVTILDRVLNKR
jgi:hypothetical protein